MAKTKIVTAKKKVAIPKAEPVKDVVKEDIINNIDLPDEDPEVVIPFTKQILEDICRSIFEVTKNAYVNKENLPDMDGYIKKEDLKDYIKKEDVEKYVQECLKDYAKAEEVKGISKVLQSVVNTFDKFKDVFK